MSGAARSFSGVTSDRLTTNLENYRGSTNSMTVVFWVKMVTMAVAASAWGAVDSGGDGIGCRINSSSATEGFFQLHNNLSGRSSSVFTLQNVSRCFAAVNSVGDNNTKIYSGLTAATVALDTTLAPALGFTAATLRPKVTIGCRNNNGTLQEPLTGILDQLCIFYDQELTLTQIREVAACGVSFASLARRYYRITGSDPETDLSPFVDPAAIFGTTVVDGICAGDGEATVVPPGNPPFPPPITRNLSGGPGGGLGIPTLDFGDGGPATLSPMVGQARMVQAPDWGSMGIKGSRGGRKGGMLSQRQSSMYRGLDHLATKLRGRRK